MNRYIKNSFNFYNRRLFLFSVFLLFSGIFAGIFFGQMLNDAEKVRLSAGIMSFMDSGSVHIIQFLAVNIIILLLILICGLSAYCFPVSFIVLFIKMFAFGLCICLTVIYFDKISPGIFFLQTLLPNIIMAIILLFSTVISSSYSYSLFLSRKQKNCS